MRILIERTNTTALPAAEVQSVYEKILHKGRILLKNLRLIQWYIADSILSTSGRVRTLGSVAVPDSVKTYINSNLRAFPEYHGDHRASEGRHGFAIGIDASRLHELVRLLRRGMTISAPDGEVRVVAPEDDPLTERELLQAARIGQGEFRDALMISWKGARPIIQQRTAPSSPVESP